MTLKQFHWIFDIAIAVLIVVLIISLTGEKETKVYELEGNEMVVIIKDNGIKTTFEGVVEIQIVPPEKDSEEGLY